MFPEVHTPISTSVSRNMLKHFFW